MAARTGLKDFRAQITIERGQLLANRSGLAGAVQHEEAVYAALERNTTGLKAQAASLIREHEKLESRIAVLTEDNTDLDAAEGRARMLRTQSQEVKARLTKIRAQLLFGDTVELRRPAAAARRSAAALAQQVPALREAEARLVDR